MDQQPNNPPEQPQQQQVPPTPSQQSTEPKKQSKLVIVASVVAFLIAGIAARVIVGQFFNNDDNGNTISTELVSNNDFKEFNATSHNFKATFPGLPEIENTTIPVEGFNIPLTNYIAEKDSENAYFIAVFDYTGLGVTDVDAALEGAFNGAAQNTPGSQIVSSTFSEFQGNRAIEGSYTLPLDGQQFEAFALIFNKSGTEKFFMISNIGSTESEHQQFKNSFTFTDQ